MSLYRDNPATEADYQKSVEILSTAFPLEDKQKSATFYALLVRCMMDEGFTAKRVYDATMHIVKTFKYKKFNIADVIQYDRKVPLYTYGEYCKLVQTLADPHDVKYYGCVEGVHFYYRQSELVKQRMNIN